MRALDRRLAAAALAFALVLACGGEKPSAPAPAPRTEPAPAAPAPAAPAYGGPVQPPAAPPAPAPASPPAAKPAPAPATPPAVKPPAEPAPPAASAHAKVGPDKCKVCHRIQHQSWAASAHAKKGLDCEGCHGNGGDYWPASVMKDRAKAAAAGLATPGLERCKECHAKPDASLLARAHAHKPR